jgi:catechol 2,3-dioxygenase-like lactoylglutathione lyase family enzyme
MKWSRAVVLPVLLVATGGTGAAAQNSGIGLQSLGHVGIAVSDLDRALHFYVGQLGLKETFRLKRPNGSPMLVYLQVANSSTFVELFPGTKTASSPALPRVYHFGFFVTNLQTSLHRLQARGYGLPQDAFKKAAKVQADGTLLYFIYDPDGNRIELSQATPSSYQAKAAPQLLRRAASYDGSRPQGHQ